MNWRLWTAAAVSAAILALTPGCEGPAKLKIRGECLVDTQCRDKYGPGWYCGDKYRCIQGTGDLAGVYPGCDESRG